MSSRRSRLWRYVSLAVGAAASQDAIDQAVAGHNTTEQAHRNLDYPDPTLSQVKDPLEAASGNARLDASAVKGLAGEIDTELGSNSWRNPGQPGQAGLTSTQVDDRIEAHTGQTSPTGSSGLPGYLRGHWTAAGYGG